MSSHTNHNQNEQPHHEDDEATGEGGIQGGPTPSLPLFPNGDDRMRLTDEEHELALIIKSVMLKELPQVQQPSDFMYAQWAIVSLLQGETSLKPISEKMSNLQSFRQDYHILDTYQDGCQAVSRMVLQVLPSYYISHAYCPQEQAFVVVADITRFDGRILSNPERTRCWMAGEYYLKHACYPDFESIRRGLINLVECKDYRWKSENMLHMNAFRRVSIELGNNYPMHFRKLKFYHTGMFFNLLISSGRKILPSLIHKTFEVGCQFDFGTLSEWFLLPTPEVAHKHMEACLQEGLRIRYENEASFELGSHRSRRD